MMKQKVRLIRHVLESMGKHNVRYVAWIEAAAALKYLRSRERCTVDDNLYYLKILQSLHTCVNGIFNDGKKFYAQFVSVHFSLCIYVTSLELNSAMVDNNYKGFLYVISIVVCTVVLPIFVCVSTTGEFKKLYSLFYNILSNYSVTQSAQLHKIMYSYGHTTSYFPCGYFNVDFTLFPTIFNFLTVIVLTKFTVSN